MVKNSNEKEYKYKFIQFSVSEEQKESIEKWSEETGYSTTSDFVRNVVLDFIRKKQNPELEPTKAIDKALLERMIEIGQNQLKLQEKTLERLNLFEDIKSDIALIRKFSDNQDYSNENESIYLLLQAHKCLTLNQIVKETGIDKDICSQILSNDTKFKININGKWCLNGE